MYLLDLYLTAIVEYWLVRDVSLTSYNLVYRQEEDRGEGEISSVGVNGTVPAGGDGSPANVSFWVESFLAELEWPPQYFRRVMLVFRAIAKLWFNMCILPDQYLYRNNNIVLNRVLPLQVFLICLFDVEGQGQGQGQDHGQG